MNSLALYEFILYSYSVYTDRRT